ncbi:Uncharacterised protein [Bordetella ansorpii]|uniref:DUF4148 domain-containing protein n=1 Tax=Bordetella ansorpii TaxID=288768 RepID=A0A157SHI5_9BORD|nr:DUF4148 domain-containing protein [Bordetella ansorpii]SAI69910.1 Uncharacterised protein [Bordetella ansorpii]
MKIFAATLLMMFGVTAYAADNVEPNDTPFQGVYGQQEPGKTRAQVLAELADAQANGLIVQQEADLPFQAANTATLSRAQVRQELAQARAAGQSSFGELDYQAN